MNLVEPKTIKGVFLTALLTSILLYGCSKDAGHNWEKITGHDMSYSAKFPKTPTYNKQSVPIPQGAIVLNIYELITKDVNYTFGCSDYPDGFLKTMGKNAKEIFDSSLKPTLQKLNAEVLETDDSFSNGFPKRTAIMKAYMPENSSNMIIRQDSYLVKGRMYFAQTLVFEGRVEKNKEIVEFFHNSLSFNPDHIKRTASVNKTPRPQSQQVVRPLNVQQLRVLKVPEDIRTIQKAIDLANDGDMIIVKGGLYRENLYFKGKNITLQKQNFTDRSSFNSPVIQGHGQEAVLTFSGTETQKCKIIGFNIDASQCRGGPVNYNGANPFFMNCEYIANQRTR